MSLAGRSGIFRMITPRSVICVPMLSIGARRAAPVARRHAFPSVPWRRSPSPEKSPSRRAMQGTIRTCAMKPGRSWDFPYKTKEVAFSHDFAAHLMTETLEA